MNANIKIVFRDFLKINFLDFTWFMIWTTVLHHWAIHFMGL